MNDQLKADIKELSFAAGIADTFHGRNCCAALDRVEEALTHAIEHMKRSMAYQNNEIVWFKNESVDDPLLYEFINNTEFDYFKKGGKDRCGRYNIFLVKNDKSVAAICSNSQKVHVHALKILADTPEPPQERKG